MMKKFPEYSLRHILLLFGLALMIGLYLIATTIVVSRDSIFYIEMAQKMQKNFADVLGERPSLYEFLILLSHRFFHAITGNSSSQGWLWAAQGITLFCRSLAIIPIYLAGCLIAAPKNSFKGCLILLALPEAAHIGSDVLREWPYLLFMSLSFFCLLYGARKNNPWAFLFVGLFGGLSFLIRSESVQIIGFAMIILAALIFSKNNYARLRTFVAGLLLILGFSCMVLLYANYSGRIGTHYLAKYKTKAQSAITKAPSAQSENDFKVQNKFSAHKLVPAFLYELFKKTGKLLMWVFLPFWAIGVYSQLRQNADRLQRFIIIALISTSVGLILFRYFCIQPIVSIRWCLPFIALTVFCIPLGIEQTVSWVTSNSVANASNNWTWAVIAVGILACLPKLIEPLGNDKKEYIDAVRWIHENTDENSLIYCFDRRIPFYANRSYVLYKDSKKFKPHLKADYLVTLAKDGQTEIILPMAVKLQKSVPMSEGNKELQIFRYDQ